MQKILQDFFIKFLKKLFVENVCKNYVSNIFINQLRFEAYIKPERKRLLLYEPINIENSSYSD